MMLKLRTELEKAKTLIEIEEHEKEFYKEFTSRDSYSIMESISRAVKTGSFHEQKRVDILATQITFSVHFREQVHTSSHLLNDEVTGTASEKLRYFNMVKQRLVEEVTQHIVRTHSDEIEADWQVQEQIRKAHLGDPRARVELRERKAEFPPTLEKEALHARLYSEDEKFFKGFEG